MYLSVALVYVEITRFVGQWNGKAHQKPRIAQSLNLEEFTKDFDKTTK